MLTLLVPALLQAPAPPADLALARGVVEACYKDHLRRMMGFSAANVKAKRRWFTPGLMAELTQELRKPSKPDEVPYIDGDPFLNSQEPVSAMKVGDAKAKGADVEVSLHLAGEGFKRELKVLLKRLPAGWRIDDLTYDDGTTLRGLLAAPH
jgi:hypothetical protein